MVVCQILSEQEWEGHVKAAPCQPALFFREESSQEENGRSGLFLAVFYEASEECSAGPGLCLGFESMFAMKLFVKVITISSVRWPKLEVCLLITDGCFRKMIWKLCDTTKDKTKPTTTVENLWSSNICIFSSLFRVLLRVRMLYYLKQEVIGNECQKVFNGIDARWTIKRFFACLL